MTETNRWGGQEKREKTVRLDKKETSLCQPGTQQKISLFFNKGRKILTEEDQLGTKSRTSEKGKERGNRGRKKEAEKQ